MPPSFPLRESERLLLPRSLVAARTALYFRQRGTGRFRPSATSGGRFPAGAGLQGHRGLLKIATMAGRRAAIKAIDWVAFAERVPPDQKIMFIALKSRSDALSAKLASLPETPPAIDWAFYRTAVAKPGLVDEFEKKFKALKIPEPVDTQTAKIDVQERETAKDAAAFIQASKERVVKYEKKLQRYKNMVPLENMTLDEYFDVFPETKPDKEKYPYWPHRSTADW